MIAKSVPASEGTRTFATGIAYVQKHEHRRQPALVGVGISFDDRVSYASAEEKAAWTHARGVSSVAAAAREMEATAALSRRCADPVQHEIIAYAKDEHPTREQMVADAERLLTALDMADHQYVMSVHTDTDDLHAHIIANRVGPDGHANARWQDRPARERVCAQIATERGWDIVVGFHNRDIVQQHLGLETLPPAPARRVYDRDFARAHGSGVLPWEDAARPYVSDAVERAKSWDDLRARLDAHGVMIKAVERGGRFAGLAFVEGQEPEAPGCAASRIDSRCKLSALEARFGPYDAASSAPEHALRPAFEQPVPGAEKPVLWQDEMRPVILEVVEGARSWDDLRMRLSEAGVVVKGVERGGRFQGLAFAESAEPGAAGCGASRIGDRCKLRALETRFGPFPDRAAHALPARALLPDMRSHDVPERARMPESERTHDVAVPAEGVHAGIQRDSDPAASTEKASPPPLRERVEREAADAGSRAFAHARGIAENARLREEYGRYRDAFYEHRRDADGERRNAAWREERALRQAESARRWEAKQMQRAFARAITPRGMWRNAAYGVVERLHERRTELARVQAHTRWESVKDHLAREGTQSRAVAPMHYRDYVAERAKMGDAGAERVRTYLDRGIVVPGAAMRDTDASHTVVPAREEGDVPVQGEAVRAEQPREDLGARSVRDVREDLLRCLDGEGKAARADAEKLRVFPKLHAEYKRVDAALQGQQERGVERLAVERDASAALGERCAEIERGIERVGTGVEKAVFAVEDLAARDGFLGRLAETEGLLLERAAAIEEEKRAIVVPPEPVPLQEQIDNARERVLTDARERAMPFTSEERQRLDDIERRKANWNPLVRMQAGKEQNVVFAGREARVHQALDKAEWAFRDREISRLTSAYNTQRQERWAARLRHVPLDAEQRGIGRDLRALGEMRKDAQAFERAGGKLPSIARERLREEPRQRFSDLRKAFNTARGPVQVRSRAGQDRGLGLEIDF